MRSSPILPLMLAAVWSAAVVSSSVQAQNKGMSLDDFLRYPGDYSQVCDALQLPFPAPIPGFRMLMHGEAGYSTARVAAMKKNRAALIPAIAARLEKVDLARKPKPQPPDKSIPKDQIDVDPVGVDPASYSTLLLAMIEELDAKEVFPQLMKVEEKIHDMLLAVEKDPAAPLPQVDGTQGSGVSTEMPLKEGEEWDTLTPERREEMDRKQKLFKAQAAQRDILAVLVRSMRKAGYEPMLESGLEKTYGKLLKDRWKDDETLSKYKSAADIPEEDNENVKFDPIHKVAYMAWEPVRIPYSEETRTAILDLAKAYSAGGRKK
ncbi:MAG: hypothetical protein EOP86_27660 [Verrucomicrobiaceae bacterium]|nr:MAG: hypothetical protein EOP86_27660 [Verrucomicrobiaceae bacterium]